MKYELDAKNQSIGRLATQIATLLRGKNLVSYTPNVMPRAEVIIKNIDKIKFTGSKLQKKVFYHYSGYHGGLKETKLSKLWAEKPQYVIRQSVYRMLPKNKMRDKIIKNLKFAK